MPGSNIRLPKVTQYVRNVGKSIAFASIDAVKNNMEGIKGFAEENHDVFVEIYSSAKNYRDTVKKVERNIKNNSFYKAIEYGAKNMVEDALSGNFYNDRTSEISESAIGVDDESLGLDFNYEVSSESSSSSSKYIADTFSDAIKTSTVGTTTAVAKGTDMVVRSTRASTTILSTQIERSTATLHSGLGAVYNSVNQINQFLNGPMMAHLENSRTYYDSSLKLMQEQHAMIREMLEVQRNLYSAQAKQYQTSKLDQSMNANGMMDMRGYMKIVKGNLINALSSRGIGGFGDAGINIPLMLAAQPFKLMLEFMADELMPKRLKNNLKSFDNTMTGLFSQFIGKMNKNKDESGLKGILSEIFGINVENKTSINTSNYNKGAVAFDGITRKTIVEVIPGYLARIEASLTGAGERHYDPHKGIWKSAKRIETDFEKDRISSIESANRGITYDLANDKRFKSKEYQNSIRKMKEQIYEDGFFDPSIIYDKESRADSTGRRVRKSSGDAYKKYGFKTREDFEAVISAITDNTLNGLATANMRAKQARSRRLEEYEAQGGIYNRLFDDTYNTDESVKPGTYSSPSKFTTGGLLNASTDKYGNNVFYYLREILKGINGRWKSGSSNGPSTRGPSGPVRVRVKNRSRESKTSSESEGDSGSDESDAWDEVNADIDEQEKKDAEERAKKSAAKNWVEDKLNKSPIGKFFNNSIKGVSEVIASPLKFINELLEQANNNMFSLMFGDMKLRDADGNEVDNVFKYIIDQVKGTFDELGKYIKKKLHQFLDPLWEKFKSKVKPYAEPVWNELKSMGRAAGARVNKGLSNTFGKAGSNILNHLPPKLVSKITNRGVVSADEVEAAAYDNDGMGYDSTLFDDNIGANARGRVVTKRGLTMISPGEIIIPASFDKKKQDKMLALEKRDRSRILNSIGLNATGNVDTEALKKKLEQIYNENKGNKAAKIGAGSIVGLGAGLLTGVNPILGAIAGAGLSILNNSDTLKNIVFGEEINGERQGGVVSKKIQDTFKKYAPDMTDYGIAGGVLGLLTPFGPLGGAAIGAGIGFLKNSEGFKKFIFGEEGKDDGLLNKEAFDAFKEKVKKAAPKMLAGAGIGILAGPFGLLGNAALGAGVGLISSTETFHKFLYGDEENGTEGIIGAFKTGFLKPAKEKFLEFAIDIKEYSKKHILEPMKDFWKPVNQMLKNVIQSTGDKVKDFLNDMFEKTLGLPLHDFLQEKIFKPMGKIMFGILKVPYNLGKAVISAPFAAARGIGNTIRASQIRRGTAYDMTANERLAWRDQHKIRFNKFNRYTDKRLEQDRLLAGMDESQLNDILMNSNAGLSSFTSLQKAAGKARSDVGKEVSKFFNTSTAESRNRFNKVGYNDVNKLTKIAQTKSIADAHEFIDKMKGLTDDEKNELKQKIAEKVKVAERANATLDAFKSGSGKIDEKLSKALGYKVKGRTDRRKIMRSAEAELKARNKISEKINESPEVKATMDFATIYNKKSDKIIELVAAIKEYSKVMAEPDAKSTEPPNSSSNKSKDLTNTDSTSKTEGSSETTEVDKALKLAKDKEKESKKPSIFSRIAGWFGFGKSHIDEDSKEAKDAAIAAAKKDQVDIDNAQYNRDQVSILTKIKEALVGKKDTEETGFLGKLWRGLGTVGKWLGIGGLALTGASLFGHLTQWFKTSIWPNLKTLMFGNDDDSTDGLVGRFTSGIRNYLFGDGTEENKGLFGNTRDALRSWWKNDASPWLETKINGVATWLESEGGFTGIFTNRIVPGFINGLGYAINNLLPPAINGLLKAAPSLLAGLGKSIWQGISTALFNRNVGKSRVTIDDGGVSAQFDAAIASANSTIESADKTGTVSSIKGAFGNLINAFKGTGSTTVELDTPSKSNNNIPSNGIPGRLGQTKRTNTVEFDENGNIITDYTRLNTTDSFASYIASAASKNFAKGLGGNSIGIKMAKGAGDDVAKATLNMAKPGILSKIKGAFGYAKAAAKSGLNVIGSAGKAGSKLNKAISNTAGSVVEASTNSSTVKKGILSGITKIFKNIANSKIVKSIADIAHSLTGKEVTEKIIKEAIEKIGKRLGDNLVSKATKATLKSLGNIIAKFSPITIAFFIQDFIWGFDNANTILGIADGTDYDITLGHKCICGLVNMLTNFFTLGLLPADIIIDICVEYLFPIFGLDTTSIQAARDGSQSMMDKWNKENPNDTYDNLQDFNNKDKWWFKAKKSFSNTFTSTKETVSKSFNTVSEKVKEIVDNTVDIGGFVKNVTTNVVKAAIDPEYTWNIDDYIAKDDPLAGAKKTIYQTLKFPLGIIGVVSLAGKGAYNKVKEFVTNSKDGITDAWQDISAACKGQYSVFNSKYWSFNNTDDDNPLSITGKIVSTSLKFMSIPHAMLGYVGNKTWNVIKSIISGAKEGSLDAQSDIDAVKSGKHTIYSKSYWDINTDSSNPLSVMGSIFGTVSRILQAPSAMLGYVGNKTWNTFNAMINGVKDVSSDTKSVIKKAENGAISIFSNEYWKIAADENNPLSVLGKVIGWMERLINTPMVLIKSTFSSIADNFGGIQDWFTRLFGESSGNGRSNNIANGRGRRIFGRGHIYQSGTISNMPYGDSTIGDSGCAPVAAANMIGGSVKEAAHFAETNGMTVPGGGTDIDFFNSYLGSKGITTRNTNSRSAIMNALANGNQVVMLGQDTYNNGAPFGTNPHYITAKGISNNGNIVVEDPDLPYTNIEYSPDAVMNSMITSVIAGSGRKHKFGRKRGLFGKGQEEYDLLNNGGYTVSSPYGSRWGKMHKGVDLCKSNNSPIYAFTNGTVKYLDSGYRPDSGYYGSPDGGGFGNYVTLIDDNGYYHVYAHLNGTNVSLGDSVSRGQQIGIQGNTGSSTGSHLHYQVTSGSPSGTSYDPYNYLLNYNQKSSASTSTSTNSVTSDISYSSSSDTTSYSSTSSNTGSTNSKTNLLTALGELGKSMVKKMYGKNAYNALFGSDTTNVNISGNDTAEDADTGSTSSYNNSNNNTGYTIIDNSSINTNPGTTMPETYTTRQIWDALKAKGYSKAGIAGIMGNMNAESGYRTNNLEDQYERKWGLSDEEYSNAVSNGSYGKEKFATDAGGYGLVQFTWHTLKRNLYKHTVEQGLRIDNLQGQINALSSQLASSYSTLDNYLKSTTDVAGAADKFLLQYENPASPESAKQKRREYAWQAYNTYGKGRSTSYGGTATRALNGVRNGRARTDSAASTSTMTVDYATFLKTIVEILISISNNTALLNNILEILSSKFDINIDANQVTDATNNSTRVQAEKTLKQLMNRNAEASTYAKVMNNKDTQYLVNAMVAIASE